MALLMMAVGSASALAAPAIITINPAPTASYATAHVSGTVDPQGNELTFYTFEYSTDETNWSPFAYEGIVPAATPGPQSISAELKGLKGGTQYSVRLVTFNFEEFVYSPEPNPGFTTLAVAKPKILSVSNASAVTYLTAMVSGSVERPANPDPAFDATCRFEYVSSEQFSASEFQGATQAPCDTNPITATGATAVTAQLSGLTPGTTYHLRLTASNSGGSSSRQAASTFTTLAVAEPAVTLADPSSITTTSAHFSGSINPTGSDALSAVNWHFQCTPECPGLEGTLLPDGNPHTVEADATGLAPNTAYEVTLVATNAINQATAGPKTFSTSQSAPGTLTGPALVPGANSAELTGTVNPYGLQASYYFEYGPTTSYGTKIPTSMDAVAGNGRTPRAVSQKITGLDPNTTYHYRLVATSSAGSTQGADSTFTTEVPVSPSGRAYEQVSPVEKHGIPIADYIGGSGIFRASTDGNSIRYLQLKAPPGAAASPILTTSLATRTSSNWSSTNINLPLTNPAGTAFAPFYSNIAALSDDFSHTSGVSNQKLTSDGVEGQWNLYRTDNATGEIKLLATDPGLGAFTSFGSIYAQAFIGASSDLRTVVYMDGEAEGARMYAATEDKGIRLVSVMPNGTTATNINGGPNPFQKNLRPVSSDGSQVYWCAALGHACAAWYLRTNVSEPQSALAPAPTATGDVAGGTGSGDLTAGSVTVTNVNTASGAFAVGQRIGDHEIHIYGETTIVAVGPGTLTLSRGAAGTAAGVEFSTIADSKTITNFNATQGAFLVGAEVFGHGIPVNTIVESVGPGTLTLSNYPTEPGTGLTITSVGACTEPAKACTIRVPAPGTLLGASSDGRYAEFGGGGSNGYFAGGRIYLFDAVTGLATDIGPGSPLGEHMIALPERGELYFGIVGEFSRLHNGTNTRISTDGEPSGLQVSPDGRYVDFGSYERLTSFDNAHRREIYLYDSQSESLVCVSCRRDGGPTVGDAGMGQLYKSENTEDWWARSVLDDGTVFFDTPDPLLAADVNHARDVYSYHAGHYTLISPGTGPGSVFSEVTPDGSDVFFTTEGRLVGQDRDSTIDLYDARVGGGLASQNPVAAPECAGEGCRGVTAVPPPPPLAGSETLTGVGNLKLLASPKPAVKKKAKPLKCRKGAVRKHNKCVKMKKKVMAKKRAAKKTNINRRVK